MKVRILASVFIFVASTAVADTDVQLNAQDMTLRDMVLGVEIKLDPQGNLIRARSSYSHPVDFPDRRGINRAYIIAEEKAKAQFVRFMSQEVTSTRVVSEIDQSAEMATRNRSEAGSTWSKQNVRQVHETLTEISSSSAKGTLRGVRVLAREYNQDLEEVTVVVGIDHKSQTAAAQLKDDPKSSARDQAGNQPYPQQSSERQTSDDF